MTQFEFLRGMKKLTCYYLKDMTEDQLTTWYEAYKDLDVDIFHMAVKQIGIKNKYFPTCAELMQEYKNQMPKYLLNFVNKSKDIPEDRKKYFRDLIDWYSYTEYPEEFLEEILNYRKQLEYQKDKKLYSNQRLAIENKSN